MKYITNETINHFKRFISKLYKKEEESLLNKKKKREEIKQKNKSEKTRVNNRAVANQYNHYYQGLYMPPMPPINTQNPAIMNEYPNYYYYNYQFPPNMYPFPPYYQQYTIEAPRTLQESLNNMYQRGIVNNIIGAFFINECQENIKKNEKRKVPISMVEFIEESNNNENNEQMNNINGNNENNTNENKFDSGKNISNFTVDDEKNKPPLEENNKEDNERDESKENQIEEEKNDSNNNNHQNELKKPDIAF